ncbi:hypothetical protein ISCGN_022482 [Ixodes scapularis]
MNFPPVSDARKVTEKKAAADAQRQEEAAQRAAEAAVFDDQSKCFQLIELVQSYPWLYAKLRRDHKDNPKRENAWKEIARQLGILHYDICRTKWKYLRDKYAKEAAKVAGTERSGCGTSDVYKPKWIYFGSLRFLSGTSTVSRRSEAAGASESQTSTQTGGLTPSCSQAPGCTTGTTKPTEDQDPAEPPSPFQRKWPSPLLHPDMCLGLLVFGQ